MQQLAFNENIYTSWPLREIAAIDVARFNCCFAPPPPPPHHAASPPPPSARHANRHRRATRGAAADDAAGRRVGRVAIGLAQLGAVVVAVVALAVQDASNGAAPSLRAASGASRLSAQRALHLQARRASPRAAPAAAQDALCVAPAAGAAALRAARRAGRSAERGAAALPQRAVEVLEQDGGARSTRRGHGPRGVRLSTSRAAADAAAPRAAAVRRRARRGAPSRTDRADARAHRVPAAAAAAQAQRGAAPAKVVTLCRYIRNHFFSNY